MKKFIKFIYPLLLLSAASLISFSCSCKCGEVGENSIPSKVIENADRFIIERTSQEFFEKYISFDNTKTQKNSLGYNLVYKLRIPEKPFVDVLIQLYADTLGKINIDRGVIGIPNCVSNPPNASSELMKRRLCR